MIYTGRPGMWQDWIKFQSEVHREEKKQSYKQYDKKQNVMLKSMSGLRMSISGILVMLVIIAWVLLFGADRYSSNYLEFVTASISVKYLQNILHTKSVLGEK